MINKVFSYGMAFVAVTIGFTSCTEDEPEDLAPELTIEEPTANQAFTHGDTLHIEWMASDDVELHEALVVLTNATNGNAVVFSDTPYVHELETYSYHEHVILDLGSPIVPQNLTLTVTVSDHAEHETTKTVNITVNP